MKLSLGPILIFSPHADDWWLGCHSIITNPATEGVVVLMSYWEGEQQDLMVEFSEGWKRTATKSWRYKIWSFPDRRFDMHTAEIRDKIWRVVQEVKPSVVMTAEGRHPDHRIVFTQLDAATVHLPVALVSYYTDLLEVEAQPGLLLRFLPDAEAKAKRDEWVDVWRSQQKRLEERDPRFNKPQVDGVERFRVYRGEVEW